MGIDANARQVLELMAGSGYPPLDQMAPPDARRAAQAAFLALQGDPTDRVPHLTAEAAGPVGPIPLRLYRPPGAMPAAGYPTCVYFHGGGFVIGDLEMYDALCGLLCEAAQCQLISVDYRLAPEARFPAAVDDCWAALGWIADHAASLKLDPNRLAVAGDSAGGNLAAVVALMARDAGAPRLRHQLLLYPTTDLHAGTDSYRANAEGYFLTGALMDYFRGNYIGGDSAVMDDWRASPLLAPSHAGLPPATILVCGLDPLHDDGVAYADALRASGVEARLIDEAGQIHGYLSMHGAIPAARRTIETLGPLLAGALA